MSRPRDPRFRQVLTFGRPLPIVIECVPNIMPAMPTSGFHTTSWTLVRAAADHPTADSREALAALCQRYWQPVYAFVRRHGYDREQSQDLTQGFFAVLIEKNYLLDTDRRRGKFRSFLLAAVKHFLANERDRANALKRGGGLGAVSIDIVEAEAWQESAVMEHVTPENLFERRWALSLLENVMVRLRSEFANEGRAEEFEKLSAFLNRDSETASYETVAEELGVSAGALRMSVHRIRRKYRRFLRAEIAETMPGPEPEQIDDELRYILSVLSV